MRVEVDFEDLLQMQNKIDRMEERASTLQYEINDLDYQLNLRSKEIEKLQEKIHTFPYQEKTVYESGCKPEDVVKLLNVDFLDYMDKVVKVWNTGKKIDAIKMFRE